MAYHNVPLPRQPGKDPLQEAENLVIERSSDPLILLSNILEVAGRLAAQWGEEILLHLRIASVWSRVARNEKAVDYLTHLACLHSIDAYHLGPAGVKYRLDLMRFFLTQIGVDDYELSSEMLAEKSGQNKMVSWLRTKVVDRLRGGLIYSSTMLTTDDEEMVQVIVRPIETWLQHAYLMPIPHDCREALAREMNSIKEYDNPADIEQKLWLLFNHCRHWHERQVDTPVWVHELDDIGPRAMYLAVVIQRPGIMQTYIERCIDALNERPLALMPNVAIAIAGLAYMAKQIRRDALLHKALDYLPRLPEHERCISAISLCEALVGY